MNNRTDKSHNQANQAQTKRFKQPEKISFMEHNRLRNMAISLRKLATPIDLLASAVNKLDIEQLTLDSIEILMRMVPTAQEIQSYREYGAQGKSLEALTDEDRFLCLMGKIDRLEQKVKIMFYMKNLDLSSLNHANSLSSSHSISSSNTDSADLLASTRSKIESVETASRSLRTSEGIRTLLEYILVFGNYLNSSSRSLAAAPAYGFKLQALDMVSEARSSQDKSRNLLHFIVETILKNLSPKEQAKLSVVSSQVGSNTNAEPGARNGSSINPLAKRMSPLGAFDGDSIKMPYEFDSLIMELEQAASVSLETLMVEVKEFERGMELCVKELHLRCAAAEAIAQQKQQHDGQNQSAPSPDSPNSIKNPSDESIGRLQNFIKSRTSEIVELRELIGRAQKEFNECAQYFGENPRTIESSSLFSIFLRHLKNFKQCQMDNKMIEKRKFDEELRKQIQQQQALRAQKKRLVQSGGVDNNGNNNNDDIRLRQTNRLDSDDQTSGLADEQGDSCRLLHQDEVSHGTLDVSVAWLTVWVVFVG